MEVTLLQMLDARERRAAAQQECKCAACNGRGKPQIPCLVVGFLFLNVIQYFMKLHHGECAGLFREIPHEQFQFSQLIRVDTSGRE